MSIGWRGISMLNYIELETCNICNRSCPWCFFGNKDEFRNRKQEYLDTYYIKKLLEELREHSYSGIISLFSVNEPLLDVRIRDGTLIRLCRNILNEKARINIVTNGDFLTDEVLCTMINAGLDLLNISCYDDEMLIKARTFYKTYNKQVKFTIYDYRRPESFNNRAGNVPVGGEYNQTHSICMSPLFTSVIGWDGEIRLCCNDVLGEVKFGNIKNQNLYDILNSRKMKEYRKIITKDRNQVFPCNKCNFIGYRLPMDNAIDGVIKS